MKKQILFLTFGFCFLAFSAFTQESTQNSTPTSQPSSVETQQPTERKETSAERREKGTCTEITRPNPSDPPSSVRVHENVTRQQCERIEKNVGIGPPLHEVTFAPSTKSENGEVNNCELPAEQVNYNIKPKWRQKSSSGTSNQN